MKHSVRARWMSWILLVSVLLLGGCTAAKLQPEQLGTIRNIGVVTLLPDEIRYTKIGITVFNNERQSEPIGQAFNEAARRSAEKALQRIPNRRVTLITDGPASLAASYYSRSMVMSDSTERIQKELAQLAQANGLDAIVVVAEVFDSDQGRAGIRVFLRAGFGEIRFAALLPDVVLHVVDKSGKVLARDYEQLIALPARRAGDQPWDYQLDANLDAATRAKLLADMERAIGQSVAAKVERVGL